MINAQNNIKFRIKENNECKVRSLIHIMTIYEDEVED